MAGETLKLTVVVMGPKPESPKLYWRPLGKGNFASIPLEHLARGVYTVALPADAVKDDFEYYIQVAVGGQTIQFPPAGAACRKPWWWNRRAAKANLYFICRRTDGGYLVGRVPAPGRW